MAFKPRKIWDDWFSHKQTMTALIVILFFLSDMDAKHDDIYESMLAIVAAVYIYIKLDKKSAETTDIVSKAHYSDAYDDDREPNSDLVVAYEAVHNRLNEENYLKRSWPWPVIKWSLVAAIAMELLYGVLTIAVVEKALDRSALWLKVLLTVVGGISPLILLTTSVLGSMVSVTHYMATEFNRLLKVRYDSNSNRLDVAEGEHGGGGNERRSLLGGALKSHWFLSAFKAWDVKSWGLLFFILFTCLSELLSVWNLLSQHEARTMSDMELISFLTFYVCEMFFNVAQINVSGCQQLEGVSGEVGCYFSDSKKGIALSAIAILIPLAAKITQTVLFAESDNPDNLNGWDCDTAICDAMTGLSVVGLVFSLCAVYINHKLETARRLLYGTSTGVSDAFVSFFNRIANKNKSFGEEEIKCPAFEPVKQAFA